jgi:hypothetical protein
MKLGGDILKGLPLALRVEIEENACRKALTQSELAAQQKRILRELREHTAPGTRTDLADTSEKDFSEVTRATQLVGRLYGESHKQVEKRLAVVAAAENAPEKDRERFGKLVAYMDRTNRIHQAHAELRRIQIEERETIPGEVTAEVIAGDFRQQGHTVADNSVDLFVTDLPYEREYVPLFGDLARFGARTLIKGGSLICYVGHHTLPEVLPLMTPHLRFHWSCAAVASEPRRRFVPSLGVATEFHQLLWFTKGKRRSSMVVVDTVKSARGLKITEHEWAQGGPVASYYIQKLSRKGSLVVDPCLGSGTFGIAALKAGRRFVGFEINPETARKAEARIARLQGVS